MLTFKQRVVSKLRRFPLARQLKEQLSPQQHWLLFVFGGASNNSVDRGRQLYEQEPMFRSVIERCSDVVETHLGWEIVTCFRAGNSIAVASRASPSERLAGQKREMVMMATFHIAQCDLWRSRGIVPDAVLGVSLGEVAAAYGCGALTLEDAMRVACALADATPEPTLPGKMILLNADYQTALQLRQRAPAALDIFGEFSPALTVLFVAASDYPVIRDFLKSEGASYNVSSWDWPYHTSRWCFDRFKLERELGAVHVSPATIPWYSSQAAGRLEPRALDALFWYGNLNRQCRFSQALQVALRDGYDTILSLEARPALTPRMEEVARFVGRRVRILNSVRPKTEPETVWKESLQTLRARGFGSTSRHVEPPSSALTPEIIARKIEELDQPFLRDPHPFYAALRSTGAVHPLGKGTWLVLGYDAASQVLKQSDSFSNAPARLFDPLVSGADSPEHERPRRALARSFTADKVADAALYSRTCADELLRALRGKAEFDLVEEFSIPLTQKVAGHLLEMPEEQVSALRQHLRPNRYESDHKVIFENVKGFFRNRIEEMHTSPRDDFWSRLIQNREESFTDEEVASLMALMWFAGTVTTETLLNESMLLLLTHPHVRDEVQSNCELIGPFIEEALRLSSPVHALLRQAKHDTSIAGTSIAAGDTLNVCLGAANRDPLHFPEPDSISLQRGARNPLMFGAGIHRCVGAMLARAELRAAVESWFEVMPGFRLAQPLCSVRWSRLYRVRSIEELMISAQ